MIVFVVIVVVLSLVVKWRRSWHTYLLVLLGVAVLDARIMFFSVMVCEFLTGWHFTHISCWAIIDLLSFPLSIYLVNFGYYWSFYYHLRISLGNFVLLEVYSPGFFMRVEAAVWLEQTLFPSLLVFNLLVALGMFVVAWLVKLGFEKFRQKRFHPTIKT